MSKSAQMPYQPLLLRLLHGCTSFFVIFAIATGFWTYDTYDGRWGGLPLPRWNEIEGIHGTFGLWALLVFPLFALYALHRGQQRLIQSSSLKTLKQVGQPLWWYTLHRITNTLALLAVTFAVLSGKMMNDRWLPKGELNHGWYYAHLISWLILVACIALHLLMSVKVGGSSLLLSMLNGRFRSEEHPRLWWIQVQNWVAGSRISTVLRVEWSRLSLPLKIIEMMIFISIISAWILPVLLKVLK